MGRITAFDKYRKHYEDLFIEYFTEQESCSYLFVETHELGKPSYIDNANYDQIKEKKAFESVYNDFSNWIIYDTVSGLRRSYPQAELNHNGNKKLYVVKIIDFRNQYKKILNEELVSKITPILRRMKISKI